MQIIKSQALEANRHHVDVEIDPKYKVLLEVMSEYYGLMEGLNTFLKELSHPRKNWRFIVLMARKYSLDYFYLLKEHPKRAKAAKIFTGILMDAVDAECKQAIKADAADNLLLFLQKIIKESGADIEEFMPVIDSSFDRIRANDDKKFFFFVKSFYQINRLAQAMLKVRPLIKKSGWRSTNLILLKYFEKSYSYWLGQSDPLSWFKQELNDYDVFAREFSPEFFKMISHKSIRKLVSERERIALKESIESKAVTKELVKLTGYSEFVETYRSVPQMLLEAGSQHGKSKGNQWKMIFLSHIMNIAGLYIIHEEILRDINRTVSLLIASENSFNIRRLIQKTFSILKKYASEFPATALNCIFNMGKGVYKTDDRDLVSFFIDSVIDFGFESPMLGGVGNDWQIIMNPVHIQNIRVWLQLIQLDPRRSTRLFSCLTIHIALCGLFIKDTDLFPRNITQLLNSNIEPVYNTTKQLVRLFPAYFNDIGAEGQLREISTKLDEMSSRRDVLIHFLRKQSHVESSNLIIGFMQAVLYFWETREKVAVESFVPPNIYKQIDCYGELIDGVHRVMTHLKTSGINLPEGLLSIDKKELKSLIQGVSGVSDKDREKVILIVKFYRLLNQKYNLDFAELKQDLSQLKAENFPNLNHLWAAIEEPDLILRIDKLLDYLGCLKEIILSEHKYEIREDIYKKRHFAADIPSMYGSYHEMKFDCLGLALRIESLVNVLFEQLVSRIDLTLITKATFVEIYDLLKLFAKALKNDGISSFELDRQVELLAHSIEVKGFTFTQYIDIVRKLTQCIKNIINDYFHNIHWPNMNKVVSKIPYERILPRFLPVEHMKDKEKLKYRISEIFFRDMLSLSLGLQQVDVFLNKILNTLFRQSNKLQKDRLHQLLLYDSKKMVTPISPVLKDVFDLIYLGNKGYNLVQLKRFDFPIPPGFIITTEAFRWRGLINEYKPAKQNFETRVRRELNSLEKITGKKFGDPSNPLILSVRSGSAVSQPGMLNSFLNVGMNEEIAESIGKKTGNPWFAWDNFRRFLQCYGMALGIQRNAFDAVIHEFKCKKNVRFKRDLTGDDMKRVALTYKQMIQDESELPEDIFRTLISTIRLVFFSWDSFRAKTYRRIMGISDDWGTAVTVQSMVFGNCSDQAGSGVIFTRTPKWSGDSLRLWGDFTLGNQGEDVVSGLVNSMPISIFQQEDEMRNTDITLETRFPEIYNGLNNLANNLVEKRGWTSQEMEFTFEGPNINDLYVLQTRDMSIRENESVPRFNFDAETYNNNILGNGIGVSGGAMSGHLVFNVEDILQWRRWEPDTPIILVRNDTVPDDIREVSQVNGLLTARGGVTSHAAVIAHRLEKTCVVGCGNMVCDEKEQTCNFNGRNLKSGDYISIDGHEGSVYIGKMKIKNT